MDRHIRAKIDGCSELQALIDSSEWANDTLGLLQRKFYEICSCNGIDEADASEYLHEEDGDYVSVAAAALGAIGGRAKSEAKATAARENGKLGGRPAKKQ